jgi:hypothetical protein
LTGAGPSRRSQFTPAGVNYWPRIVGHVFIVATLLSIPDEGTWRVRVTVAAFCLLWPHLAYWFALKRGGDARAERMNVLIESCLGGVLAVAVGLRLWPVVAFYSMGMINLLLIRGTRFLLVGLAVSGLGFLAAWLVMGLEIRLEAEPIVTALSIAGIVSYVVFVGAIAYRLRIRQRETHAAIEREERKSHDLLVNVFPEVIVPGCAPARPQSPISSPTPRWYAPTSWSSRHSPSAWDQSARCYC